VVSGWPSNNVGSAPAVTLWLKCPNAECEEGSVKLRDGSVYPSAPAGRTVAGLSDDVAGAWREARIAHNVGAYTAAEMMFRKILMYVAVDKAGSKEGESFESYVNDLEANRYLTPGLKDVVDQVRQRGNGATHELPSSDEKDSLQTMAIVEYLLMSLYELPGLIKPATTP
jgi:hypothetical protein